MGNAHANAHAHANVFQGYSCFQCVGIVEPLREASEAAGAALIEAEDEEQEARLGKILERHLHHLATFFSQFYPVAFIRRSH